MEIKKVRTNGPIYDLRVNILSFFNLNFFKIFAAKINHNLYFSTKKIILNN